jgi:DNA mismatch endonuclease (patch repair protein)
MERFFDTPESRRRNMRAIRSKGNRSTEARLRAALVSRGIQGWIMHDADLLGKPDFYFQETRVAIFVDGCFWHGCPLCGHTPKTNTTYWAAKLSKNQQRDLKTNRLLRACGISVLRLWECEIKYEMRICLQTIQKHLLHRQGKSQAHPRRQ